MQIFSKLRKSQCYLSRDKLPIFHSLSCCNWPTGNTKPLLSCFPIPAFAQAISAMWNALSPLCLVGTYPFTPPPHTHTRKWPTTPSTLRASFLTELSLAPARTPLKWFRNYVLLHINTPMSLQYMARQQRPCLVYYSTPSIVPDTMYRVFAEWHRTQNKLGHGRTFTVIPTCWGIPSKSSF